MILIVAETKRKRGQAQASDLGKKQEEKYNQKHGINGCYC